MRDNIIRSHRRLFFFIFQLVIGALAFFIIIHFTQVDFSDLKLRFENISWNWLALGVFFFFISMIIIALRYKTLIEDPQISLAYWFGLSLFMNSILTFVPFRIGELGFPYLLLKDQKVNLRTSLSVLIFVRIIDFLIVILAGLWGFYYLHLDIDWYMILERWPLLIIALSIFGTLLWVIGKEPSLRTRLTSELIKWRDYFSSLILNIGKLLSTIILSTSYFFIVSLQSLCILTAMGLHISLTHVITLSVITILASLLPIHPPGGWGTIDSIQILILSLLGYSLLVSSTILSAHLVYSLLILFGGIVGWIFKSYNRSITGLDNETKTT